jgi:hypothetical protein
MRIPWLMAVSLTVACTARNPRFKVTLDGGLPDTSPPASDGQVVDMAPPDPPPPDMEVDPPPPQPDGQIADPVGDTGRPDLAPPDAPGVDLAVADIRPIDLAPIDTGPDVFTPPSGCGTSTADITGIKDADGVVVDTDGTVYFLTDDAQHSYVGRILPGPNQKPDITWLRITNSPTTWGLALDSIKQRVYVIVVDAPGAIVYFDDIKGAPIGGQLVTGVDDGNDVTVAADGTVFYTQQTDRHIYSVPRAGGTPKRVTTTALGTTTTSPAGLLAAPDGGLLVGLENAGPIYKITLNATGGEATRNPIGAWMGWANGLTYDHGGRLYISIYHDTDPRSVVRLEADGKTTTTITTGGRFSSIAFGRGPLDCRDIYIADPFGPMRRVRVNDSL